MKTNMACVCTPGTNMTSSHPGVLTQNRWCFFFPNPGLWLTDKPDYDKHDAGVWGLCQRSRIPSTFVNAAICLTSFQQIIRWPSPFFSSSADPGERFFFLHVKCPSCQVAGDYFCLGEAASACICLYVVLLIATVQLHLGLNGCVSAARTCWWQQTEKRELCSSCVPFAATDSLTSDPTRPSLSTVTSSPGLCVRLSPRSERSMSAVFPSDAGSSRPRTSRSNVAVFSFIWVWPALSALQWSCQP